MSRFLRSLGGLVAVLALTYPGAASAQVVGAAGYNPYTGTGGRAAAGYNPYTGTRAAGGQAYNPYTGATRGASATTAKERLPKGARSASEGRQR